MKLRCKSLFLFPVLVFVLALNVPKVNAEPTAKIYPTEGTVYTDIFLQVRGFGIGEGWDVHYKLYLFWDSEPIMTGVDDGGGHFYDIYFYPPNERPYSDLGNHTVYIELWRSHYGWTSIANFTLVFRIIKWAPSPEYIALNSTYSALLADYGDLDASYSALQAQYNDLTNTHQELLADYNAKLANYSSLSESYNSLCASYDALETNYNFLESDNAELATSYKDLISELAAARNLGYIFIVTTMILISTTVYFATRKSRFLKSLTPEYRRHVNETETENNRERKGNMRLAESADEIEPLKDPRVQENDSAEE